MADTTGILLREYGQLQDVYGDHFMHMLFNNFAGYCEIREENTFYHVRDQLSELTLKN